MYEKTKLTIHGAPVAVNAISYALFLKSYMKFVHNRPMEKGLNASQLEIRKLGRNRQLGIFCIIGAPLTMLLLRASSIPMKDMFTLSVGGESQVATNNNNSNLINSTLFLSTLLKKIPRWLKILFKIFFLTIFLLKLFGFSFLSVFLVNAYFLKLGYCIIISLVISYHLLSLYLLHQFSNKKKKKKKIKILEVLPDFVIN
jgi:hypothetical protein